MVTYLFPSDPLGGHSLRVDDHFAGEYSAASKVASVALLDSYSLGDLRPRLSLPALHEHSDRRIIYRGWMLFEDEYTALALTLAGRGYSLLTTVPAYLETHSIEGWFERFRSYTPATGIFDSSTMDAAAAVELGQVISPKESYFLKGLTKSDPDFSRAEGSDELLDRLAALGENLGEDAKIALRNYDPLNSTVAELRSWWLHGELLSFDLHPNFTSKELNSPLDSIQLRGYAREFLGELKAPLSELRSGFLTADIALTAFGEWILIELGDGQVSGLRRDWDTAQLEEFYGKLTRGFGQS